MPSMELSPSRVRFKVFRVVRFPITTTSPFQAPQTRMRLFLFLLGVAILLGIPLLLSQLGPPPATKPTRMREAEIDMIEFERIQRERKLTEEGSDTLLEGL